MPLSRALRGQVRPGVLIAAVLALGDPVSGRDGKSFTDLLMAQRETTFLLFNRGDGTFLAEDYGFGRSDGVAVGDFDRDGDVDLAVLDGLLLGHNDLSFTLVPFAWDDINLCRETDNFLEFADVDADGRMDVVLGCLDTVVIYYGTGDARVLERGTVLLTGASYRENTEGPTVLAVGDMDEDGLPDIMAGQGLWGVQFFLNRGGRSFWPLSAELPDGHRLKSSSGFEHWVDFNRDGHLDIVSPVGVDLGDGTLGFTRLEVPQEVRNHFARMEIADLDGDKELDIAGLGSANGMSQDTASPALILLFGRGDGTIREFRQIKFPDEIEVGEPPSRVWVNLTDLAIGDFNGGGTLDIALSNWGGLAALWILDGAGAGNFGAPRTYPGPTGGMRIVALGDVDRQFVRGDASDDGRLTITDVVVILLALFGGRGVSCGQALDADDDSHINLADAVFLLQYLFLGGPPPPAPYPAPGIDATDPLFDDGLRNSYPGCSPESWELFRKRRANPAGS
jgi:FG-GAP-like repeat